MRLASPRIVVIDDTAAHLRGLGQCFARDGAASLQILFTGEMAAIVPCADARVIFADLHLVEGGGAAAGARDFALIGGVIETLKPQGPYVLVLWTRYPDHATALKTYLRDNLRDVAHPFDVVPLDKMQHLTANGDLLDAANLTSEIRRIYRAQPQIAALVDWEEHVMTAAAQTLSSLLGLVTPDEEHPDATLARLLMRLGAEAVGAEHVEAHKFTAVNEALLPILADRIGSMSAAGSDDVWNKAFEKGDLASAFSLDDAAQLNRTVHIAEEGQDAAARGAVVLLSALETLKAFAEQFGSAAKELAVSEFCCKDYADGDAKFRWLAIQTQAACDFAQKRRGTVPFLLALEMPWASVRDGSPPAAAWVSPPLFLNSRATAIVTNFRFPFALTPAQCQGRPDYRMREQLLTSMAHDYHSYGARPGTLNFKEVSAKDAAKLAALYQQQPPVTAPAPATGPLPNDAAPPGPPSPPAAPDSRGSTSAATGQSKPTSAEGTTINAVTEPPKASTSLQD